MTKCEGWAIFCLATYSYYFQISGTWWLYFLLALAPDFSMLGYAFGAKVGTATYNVFHTYTITIIVLLVGLIFHMHLVLEIGLIWAGHIGVDRGVGYNLKNVDKFW